MVNNGSKITVVGGGSTWTPGILKAITNYQEALDLKEIVLYDIDEERQKPIGEFGKLLFKELCPGIEFKYTTDKETAYKNVDYIFCQIRTGGYKMRELDEKIPLQEGVIGQETCGAGGFAYGIRSLKDMIEMVKDIRKYSKNAWILNYTNPAAIVAYGLTRAFKNDKRILNICDQPINMIYSMAKILNIDPQRLNPSYFGLNHFGWFTHLHDENGEDLLPKLKEMILEHGFAPKDAEQRDKSWLDTYALVEDMVRDFSEYIPSTYVQYYLYPQYKTGKLDTNYTRANEVINGREKKVFNECRNAVENGTTLGSHVVQNDAHGEMIVQIADTIHNNKNKTYIVMVENNGIIPNLPQDAIVEVACILGNRGPIPFHVGEIGTFYKGLLENQYAYEKLTVEAFEEGSYTKALQALTLNRTIVDAKKARVVLDKLIEANKGYWPELK
ncbi:MULTISPECIES: 6-phospho-alpha-glucosidase [Clostridium]|uniref:6-phospho-alpha-glucosidase n=1 Tax=Clostridium cadaveris TaxID=1529 RepID=A0A1I2P7E8_9CLOT|nr:6-phospho-alpha-glucosidase [Clostridium cadaveris]MDU4953060.1 6-phospho-alpha-glucosidase [Clostridium sp.]MDM8312947.1 6-phospho-alpha-glucosidase [Clostridium cadaveris]NME65780.1 6-phospho-alpha-glucosidase [Clostridium cadaveris]PWL55587.1 MAG: 6-phospho-alpha-glucosidase [Clostridium cadaveris]SFG11443.1 maltose-6'-phosphate glucosidase [Clostridium cadaveris]